MWGVYKHCSTMCIIIILCLWCIINYHKLKAIPICYIFCGSEVWARLLWVLCLRSDGVSLSNQSVGWPVFSSGDWTVERSFFKPPYIVGGIHVLVAVVLMTSCSFKVSKRASLELKSRVSEKARAGFTGLTWLGQACRWLSPFLKK